MKRFTSFSLFCSSGTMVFTATGEPSHVASHTSLQGRVEEKQSEQARRERQPPRNTDFADLPAPLLPATPCILTSDPTCETPTHPKLPFPMLYFSFSLRGSISQSNTVCSSMTGFVPVPVMLRRRVARWEGAPDVILAAAAAAAAFKSISAGAAAISMRLLVVARAMAAVGVEAAAVAAAAAALLPGSAGGFSTALVLVLRW